MESILTSKVVTNRVKKKKYCLVLFTIIKLVKFRATILVRLYDLFWT